QGQKAEHASTKCSSWRAVRPSMPQFSMTPVVECSAERPGGKLLTVLRRAAVSGASGENRRNPMNVFDFRDRLIADYVAYVTSFISIRDPRIRERVDQDLAEGLLWPEPSVGLNPSFAKGA